MLNRFAAGPPLGGLLYQKLGFNAPFIFGIILTVIDFIGRLLVVERKEALKWGVDPWTTNHPSPTGEAENGEGVATDPLSTNPITTKSEHAHNPEPENAIPKQVGEAVSPPIGEMTIAASRNPPLTSWGVLLAICRSPRAVAAFINTLAYGYVGDQTLK